ncbi:MAG: SUMF1/EgtB/PvdO family nonheme iron enzyme [Polyangiaceae bacterium]|nr:SUMF1/EgtB/PvdO family nonheme iron enzyme [Polyangiaceae bacterium]
MARAGWVLGLLFVATVGCQKVWGFEDFEEGAAGATGSGGTSGSGATGGGGATGGTSGSGGSAGAGPCLNTSAPAGMIGVRSPNGVCFWIDPYEVKHSEYEQILKTTITPPGGCEWNSSMGAPQKKNSTVPCLGPGEWADAGADAAMPPSDAPVTCVDWCDAQMFCKHAGKTLCTAGSTKSANEGAWYDACSSNDANEYPYSDQHQTGYCNDSTHSAKALVGAGSMKECKTPAGVFDMTGNAREWVDACTGSSQTSECATRGGSYADDSGSAKCKGNTQTAKELGLPTLGFRCCWLPPAGDGG